MGLTIEKSAWYNTLGREIVNIMNEQPDIHLPPPSFESNPSDSGRAQSGLEQMPNPETVTPIIINSNSNTSATSSLLPMPGYQLPQIQPMAGVITQSAVVEPPRQNVPHLEDQYIERAKRIIATTQGDPHVRATELNRNKAEFLDRKYGKKIKVSDD